MSTKIRGVVAILLTLCGPLASVPSPAQAQPQEVRVVTRVLPPMVTDQKGQLGGFSIELWNRIAEKLDLKTRYEVAPDVRGLLDTIRNGKADSGISAVSITAAREREFDFSQPMLNAGLQIMIRGAGQAGDSNPLSDLLGLLFSKAFLVWIGIAVLLILIPAHLVWFLERRDPNGIFPTRDYYPGILHALYWAAATLATQAEQAPRQWLARVVTVLWMFTGVVFVALYTAQLAASLTVKQIQGGIGGPDDLPGRKVQPRAAAPRSPICAMSMRK
jgi:polar amino acid transport system substrate-binding protein